MYNIRIEKAATKYILKLDRPTANRIRQAIQNIAEDPTIGEPLTRHSVQYKYRVGSYRILYDVHKETITVVIVKIGPRGNVYNN